MEAAFFDLDKTILAKSSVLAFSRPLYQEGLISRRVVARAVYGQVVYMLVGADEAKMERVRESMLRLTRGWEQQRVKEIVRDALEVVIEPIVFAEARELLEQHAAAGRKVVIISSSPQEVVEPLAAYLGVRHVVATRARLDEEGRYTGDVEFYAYGPHKAEAMLAMAEQEGIDLAASYAYSDSITDAPMLEVVGHPTAVNPDKELAKLAAEHGWEIRHFVHPVRLRDRVPVPPKGPTIAASTTLAAVGAGALLYSWWRRRLRPG